MKGESLYEVYCEEMMKATGARPRCPSWKNLLPSERHAWTNLAAFLQTLITKSR